MRSSTLRRRASLGTAAAALGVGLSALAAHPAAAQTVVYNNTTTGTGFYVPNGGATAASPKTTMVADDITPIAGFTGASVTGFTFSVYNANAASTTFTPTAYFYSSSPVDGGPGTLLASVPINPITATTGPHFYTVTNAAGFFNLPAIDPASGTSFWAGLSFSGASSTALNNLGQLSYDPPTVGSSQDVFFQSTGQATTAGNPVGSYFYFGGAPANPAGNLAWSFSVTTPPAVPEASTTVSFGLLLTLGMGGLLVASKRKKASAQV